MQLKDTKNIMININKYIEMMSNQIKIIFDESVSIKYRELLFINLAHYTIILQYLDLSMDMKRKLINILIEYKKYYFQENGKIFNGLPLLSLILLINKKTIGENYNDLQKEVISLINKIELSNEKFKDIEYINGISGLLNYYLIISQLDSSFILEKSNRLNLIINSIVEFLEINLCNLSTVNLGLSHGISGVLLVLTRAYTYGYKDNKIRNIILKLQKILIANYLLYGNNMPGIIEKNNVVFPRNTPSWCYSELGGLHAIIESSKILQFNTLISIFERELRRVILDKRNYRIISPNFCHGYSGILVFYTLYGIDKKEIKNYLLEQIESSFDQKCNSCFYDLYYNEFGNICYEENFSFLDGSVSVLLSLLYANGQIPEVWEKMLLLHK